jgi:type VI secretion system protein ImpK
MTDAFAALVGPVFQRLIDLQHRLDRGEHPPLEAERDQLLALLGEAEQKASTSSQLAHDFGLARHALVYWIDEVLIGSGWKHAMEWRQQILEWELYHERLRADRFFEKARDAELLADTDPLETFYLCVALGFRGRYVDSPPELLKWGERVYTRVVGGSRQADRFLPDDPGEAGREALRPLPGKSVLLAVSALVSATVLLTLACFILAVNFTA